MKWQNEVREYLKNTAKWDPQNSGLVNVEHGIYNTY